MTGFHPNQTPKTRPTPQKRTALAASHPALLPLWDELVRSTRRLAMGEPPSPDTTEPLDSGTH